MTFVNFKLEKMKFKSSGGVIQLSNPDQGYVFARVKAKPLALKVIGGDMLRNIKDGNKAPNLCYHDNSFYFGVIPGAVNYLGTVDQKELIQNLDFALANIERPSKWVTNAIVGEFIKQPKITSPSKIEVDLLTDFLKANRPRIVPNVVAVSETIPFKAKRKHAIVTGEFTCM